MERHSLLLIISCVVLSTYAWSMPFYPVHAAQRIPHRFIRHVSHVHQKPPQPFRISVPAMVREPTADEQQRERPKRDHDYDKDHDYNSHDHDDNSHDHDHKGVTGPVHTFVKTDKNANYKWGVRHHVGNKFAS